MPVIGCCANNPSTSYACVDSDGQHEQVCCSADKPYFLFSGESIIGDKVYECMKYPVSFVNSCMSYDSDIKTAEDCLANIGRVNADSGASSCDKESNISAWKCRYPDDDGSCSWWVRTCTPDT